MPRKCKLVYSIQLKRLATFRRRAARLDVFPLRRVEQLVDIRQQVLAQLRLAQLSEDANIFLRRRNVPGRIEVVRGFVRDLGSGRGGRVVRSGVGWRHGRLREDGLNCECRRDLGKRDWDHL